MGKLLTVRLGHRIMGEVEADQELPWHSNVSAEFESDAVVSFEVSSGKRYSHDLASAIEDGAKWLHLSVSVRPGYVVIADCLLSEEPEPPIEAFQKGDADAIRFQPFFLPERELDTPDMRGRGLFSKGFHAVDQQTPGNVTLSCICDHCEKSFRLISFHAGFKHVSYLYCSEEPHTLLAPSNAQGVPPIFGPADAGLVARFEATVPPCMICGGVFRYYNSFRCPHCKEPYIDFEQFPEEREIEYYGNQVYNSDLQEWAPG